MPPRRTSLQVDVSRVLYYVCRVVDRVCIQVDQGMPHQQAQALTVAHNPLKALADSGAASLCCTPWETPASSMARRLADYILN